MTRIQTCSKCMRLAAPAILIVSLAACRVMGTSMSDVPSTYGAVSAMPPSQMQAGAFSPTDQKLMTEIAQANLAEIDTAELALRKSQNPQVRTFAQRMIDDHRTALRTLMQLADSKNDSKNDSKKQPLPSQPDAAHLAAGAALGALSGAAFDQRYLAQAGIGDHQRTHELLDRTARTADDPQLSALARKLLPVVDAHLAMAQRATAGQ